MPLPRVFAIGLWLAVTVASTAMVWTATSIVAADVTDRPAPVIAHQDVVSELASGPATSSTTTPARPPAPTTTVPAASQSSAPTGPVAAPPGSQVVQPGATAVPVVVPTTTVTTTAPPVLRPVIPVTTAPPVRPTATYSTNGGVVGVACNGFFIELLSAIPRNGFGVRVISGGPANVEVHFVGPGQDQPVRAVCFGGPIRY